MTKISLLDWDGTLRKGYMSFDWLNYLVEVDLITKSIPIEFDFNIRNYNSGQLSYNLLIENTNQLIGKSLKGLTVTQVSDYASHFASNNENLNGFTKELFNYFSKNRIKPIIISGSIDFLVEKYINVLGTFEIFATRFEIIDGKYSGRTLKEYGTPKSKNTLTKQLIKKYGKDNILSAFGDSIADSSLFSAAKKGFIVESNSHLLPSKRINVIKSTLNFKDFKPYLDE